MKPKRIQAPGLPTPLGHYSQASIANGFVFVSGLLGFVGEGSAPDLEQQVAACLEQLEMILHESGCSLCDVVSVRIYISNVDDWPAVNAAYAEYLGDIKPSRAIVPVSGLHFGAKVELEAVAATPFEN